MKDKSGLEEKYKPQAEYKPIFERPDFSTTAQPGQHPKRKSIITACLACRRRKSKCDGELPACASCRSVYNTDCRYVQPSDGRHAAVARKSESAEYLLRRVEALESVLMRVRECSEEALPEVVEEIRSAHDINTLLQHQSDLSPLSQNSDINNESPQSQQEQMIAEDMSQVMGKLRVDQDGEVRYFGPTSHLTMFETANDEVAKAGEMKESKKPRDVLSRTAAGRNAFVSHLLDLYFSWTHPFSIQLSRGLFMRDYNKGGGKYCTPILLNAVLASACHLSDDPAARTKPDDPASAGNHFFAEAVELLQEVHSYATVANVQALSIMSSREAGNGHNAAGWIYSGLALRMSSDLGLHLDCDHLLPDEVDYEDIEARKMTFWGLYVYDKGWSKYLGRQPQLSLDNITVGKPAVDLETETGPWLPVSGEGPGPAQISHLHEIFHATIKVSELMDEALLLIYSPHARLHSATKLRNVADIYHRLTKWKSTSQPAYLSPKVTTLAGALVLECYYHTGVLVLLRPWMLCHPPLQLPESAHTVCTRSAESITRTLQRFRELYTLRRIVNMTVHMLYTATTIHLANIASGNAEEAWSMAKASFSLLRDMRNCWPAAGCHLRILGAMAHKWELGIPEEWSAGLQAVPHSENLGFESLVDSVPLWPTFNMQGSFMTDTDLLFNSWT